MWTHRMVPDTVVEQAACPGHIWAVLLNNMRTVFAPIEILDTRIFRHYCEEATCVQMSIPGTISPQQPHAED